METKTITLKFKKEVKNSIVYANEDYGMSVYVPKTLISTRKDQIKLTIEA